MSVRDDVLAALTADLDPALFRVSTRADVPDYLDPGLCNVRLFTESVVPGPTLGLLAYSMELFLTHPSQDPDTVDSKLDAGLDGMLAALLDLRMVQFRTAERVTMSGDEDAQSYAAYKITLLAYANTEGT